VVDDLASIPTDAVARPATSRLESVFEPIGVDQLAASPGWQPLPLDRPLDVSAALVTDDGSLAADFVIHAVVSSPTKAVSAEGVQRAIRSVLERANDWKFSRIAMPVLGGDASQLGVAAAAQTVLDTVLAGRTAPCPTEVCIVVDSEEDESVVDALLRRGKSP
jgi:O-acetyl-ADP-ribose deacetylase (regulator of RNase III)